LYSADEMLPTPADFHRVLAEGDIEPVSAELVARNGVMDMEPIEDMEAQGKENKSRFRVELPARGTYFFDGWCSNPCEVPLIISRSAEQIITDSAREGSGIRVKNGTSRFNRKYFDRINRRWWGRFFEVPEHGPPVVYFPVSADTVVANTGFITPKTPEDHYSRLNSAFGIGSNE